MITGGTGLVGRALAASLAADGVPATILSRSAENISGLPEGTKVKTWDGLTPDSLASHLEEADALVHLCGYNIMSGYWTKARKELIRDSRVLTTRAVCRAVESIEKKPSVVVQASAVGCYGPRGDEEITEDAPLGHDFLADLCRDWEKAGEPLDAMGVRRVIIRTSVVLSDKGGALVKMLPSFKFYAGGWFGTGKQWFPWIHIADEVGAIRFLLENKEAKGPFNLAAPNPATSKEFSKILAAVLHRPSWLNIPSPLLRIPLGDMASIFLEGQKAVPKRLLDLGYQFKFTDAREALKDLLRPKPICSSKDKTL